MAPGLLIAGLFLAITGGLVFTAWAEAWLASTAVSTRRRRTGKPSVGRPVTDLDGGDEVIRAA